MDDEAQEQLGALVWDSVDGRTGMWMVYDEQTRAAVPGAAPVRVALESGKDSLMATILQKSPFVKWVGHFCFRYHADGSATLLCQWPHSATIHVPFVKPDAFVQQWTLEGVFDVANAGHDLARRLMSHHQYFQQWVAWRSLRSCSQRKGDVSEHYALPEAIMEWIPHIVPAADIEREWNNQNHAPPGDVPAYVTPNSPECVCAMLLACVLGATSIYRKGLIPGYTPSKYAETSGTIADAETATIRLSTPISHFAAPYARAYALPLSLGSAYVIYTIRATSKAPITWQNMMVMLGRIVSSTASPCDPEPVDWSFVFQSQINTSDLYAYVHAEDHRTTPASEIEILKRPIRISTAARFFAITRHIAPKRNHCPWFSVRGSTKRSIGMPHVAPRALEWLGSMPETLFKLWSAFSKCWPLDAPWKISLKETHPGRFALEAARASCTRPDTIVVVPWAFFHDASILIDLKRHSNVKHVIPVQSLAKTLKKSEHVRPPIVWLWADWVTPMEWFYMTLALCELNTPQIQPLLDCAHPLLSLVTLHLSTCPPIFVDGPQQAYLLHRLAAVPSENVIRIDKPSMTTTDALLNRGAAQETHNAPEPSVQTLPEAHWDLSAIHARWTSDVHRQTLLCQLSNASVYVRGLGSHYHWERLQVRLIEEVKVGDHSHLDWYRGGMCGLNMESLEFQAQTAPNVKIKSILTMHPMNAC